ncbi:MAG: hypothetical protein ACFFBH_08280 [Promethearchaeota archaeon]
MSFFEEKVLSLLEQISEKLDKLLEPITIKTTQIDNMTSERTVKPSSVVEKQEEEEKALEHPPIEGRRVCPDCASTDFRTEEDKSQVLHQMGGIKIYAKKYICKRCGKVL